MVGALIALHAAGIACKCQHSGTYSKPEMMQPPGVQAVLPCIACPCFKSASRNMELGLTPQLLQVLAPAARQQQEQQAKQQPPQAPAAPPAAPPAQPQTAVRTQEPDPVLLYKLERVERQVGSRHGS